MARHQNQAVKRARERNKRLKAEDKRAKRQKRKDLPQDATEPHHGNAASGPSGENGPAGQPTEAPPAAQDAALRSQGHPAP